MLLVPRTRRFCGKLKKKKKKKKKKEGVLIDRTATTRMEEAYTGVEIVSFRVVPDSNHRACRRPRPARGKKLNLRKRVRRVEFCQQGR